VLGFLTTLLKAMGYTQGRNALKAQELAVKGAVEVAHVLPLVQEGVALLKELKAERAALAASKVEMPLLPPSTPPVSG
jgi:hypothetical protein